MAESFTHTITGDVAKALGRAQVEIEKNGGSFVIKGEAGSFIIDSPKIKGKFVVSGIEITVTITERPWPIPLGFIKNQVTAFLDDERKG